MPDSQGLNPTNSSGTSSSSSCGNGRLKKKESNGTSSLLPDSENDSRPWLVHTCGPMGSGKGYVLGWMSATGLLPLETVSKIDPDHFKRNFPEWGYYLKHSLKEAATHCHEESSLMAEIAQESALRRNANVWIDGSLW